MRSASHYLDSINQLQHRPIGDTLIGLYMLTGGIQSATAGDLITIVAAAMYAVHLIFVAKFNDKDLDLIRLNFQQMLVVGLSGLLLNLVFNYSLEIPSMNVFWNILFLVIFNI